MTSHAPETKHCGLIAAAIEYTDLRKEITYRDVETMCTEAVLHGLGAVVVPSALVRAATGYLADGGPAVATVISFPFGTQSVSVKAQEASVAVEQGASELDIIPHFGAILAGRWNDLRRELAEIRNATGKKALKLVLEIDRLSTEQIREACAVASDCGFDYVANTVGFRLVSTDPNAQGSASAQVVKTLYDLSRNRLKVKAAGGVTTTAIMGSLIDAGARRVAVNASLGSLRALGMAPRPGEGE